VLLGAATGCLEVPVGQICIIDREFREQTRVHTFEAGQLLSNSFSIDEHGGIYVATGALAPGQAAIMHKLVCTGKQLSADQADGAWTAEYPGGGWAPAVKVGTGTGSTPTLMGFGPGADHLVVITDGQDRMHLTAFWRDDLPAGATSRIAGTIPVTCGLPRDVAWIQSEQSVATLDWGALVVNNVTTEGQADRLIDVLASGRTVHRTVFGKITAGNGAYALVQILPDGDMIFTSVTGPVRVPLSRLDPKPIEPALARPGS
jgi:hypothetical protein